VASSAEARRERVLLVTWAVAVFAVSAVTDLRALAAASAVSAVLFHRGLARVAGRVLRSVVPVTAGLSIASWGWTRVARGAAAPLEPFLALGLRTLLIAFLTFSVLARVDLLRAVAPFPTLSRLVVVTLAQIHALRLLATESLQGLRSRLPRRPGTLDVARGAGGITGALFTLQARNARDISDAMRSRGF
jgi:cobalt/nickel transport system permease protein